MIVEGYGTRIKYIVVLEFLPEVINCAIVLVVAIVLVLLVVLVFQFFIAANPPPDCSSSALVGSV